jgi:hypothetical protein
MTTIVSCSGQFWIETLGGRRMPRQLGARGRLARIGLRRVHPDRHSGRMKTLPFGGSREIAMSIEGPQGLVTGAGLHRLMFYAHVKAHAIPPGVPVTLSGEAFLSGGMHDWLGAWSVEHQPRTGSGVVGSGCPGYRAKISVAGVGVGWNDTSPNPAWASQDR